MFLSITFNWPAQICQREIVIYTPLFSNYKMHWFFFSRCIAFALCLYNKIYVFKKVKISYNLNEKDSLICIGAKDSFIYIGASRKNWSSIYGTSATDAANSKYSTVRCANAVALTHTDTHGGAAKCRSCAVSPCMIPIMSTKTRRKAKREKSQADDRGTHALLSCHPVRHASHEATS